MVSSPHGCRTFGGVLLLGIGDPCVSQADWSFRGRALYVACPAGIVVNLLLRCTSLTLLPTNTTRHPFTPFVHSLHHTNTTTYTALDSEHHHQDV